MEVVYVVSLLGLTLAAGLVLVRLLQGPTSSDRIVALDTLLLVVVGGVAVQVARLDEARFAPVLVVVSLLAFVGTTTVARFVEKRTADEESGWAATDDDGADRERTAPGVAGQGVAGQGEAGPDVAAAASSGARRAHHDAGVGPAEPDDEEEGRS